ncbi:MAG: porin [Clostridium sp.]|nr:porin [Clostridium sp.]
MKKTFAAVCLAAFAATAAAQDSDFKFKLYGRVRADLFYNTRANEETVDGLFYMYPKNHSYDADGNDLNGDAQGSLYVLYTRLGVDIAGPELMGAKTTAKIEGDFRGSSTTFGVIRLRQAYVNLDWGQSALLVGQTWHPLTGDITPSVFNLNTGAPFQPFNRSPLVRYRYKAKCGVQLTAAAVWQSQYNSVGPNGKSASYLKNGCIPELYAGIDYKRGGFAIGAGVDFLSLKPRKQNEVDGKIYKVSERVNSVSAEAHVKYQASLWQISAKTALASNLTQCSMLGGYAATSVDSRTGEMKYTPFRSSTSWLNFTYGKKWRPGIYLGYMKNLGTGKEIKGPTYGTGLDVDQIVNVSAQLSYNLPHWTLGFEFTPCTAWYGQINKKNGKVVDTKAVTNYRFLLAMIYSF